MMTMKDTSCCGIREISGLAQTNSAQEALDLLVLAELGNGVTYHNWAPKDVAGKKVYSNYLFTAAIYNKEMQSSGNRAYSLYGDEFRDLILKLNLGTIIETPAVVNGAFHPDHAVKAYMWTVDQDAICEYARINYPLLGLRRIQTKIDTQIKTRSGYITYRDDPKRCKPGDYYWSDYDRAIKNCDKIIEALKNEWETAKQKLIEEFSEKGMPLPEISELILTKPVEEPVKEEVAA